MMIMFYEDDKGKIVYVEVDDYNELFKFVMVEKVDEFGVVVKMDFKEIVFVRKLDWFMMVRDIF